MAMPTTGLIAHYKPETLSGSDGDAYGDWTDSGSGGNNATEGTNKPTLKLALLNGFNGLRFSTSTVQKLVSGLSRSAGDTGRTYFFVLKNDETAGYGDLVSMGNDVVRIGSGANVVFDDDGGWAPYSFTPVTCNVGYRMIVVVVDLTQATNDAKLAVYQNSGSKITNTFFGGGNYGSSFGASSALRIGIDASTGYAMGGDLIEMGVYSSALGSTDRADLFEYGRQKFFLKTGRPSTLANLKFWLRTSDLVGLSDTNTIPVFPDSAGYANDFVQATSGNRPVYRTGIRNGYAAARFTATSAQIMTCAQLSVANQAELTLFVACQYNSATAQQRVLNSSGGTNGVILRQITNWTSLVLVPNIARNVASTNVGVQVQAWRYKGAVPSEEMWQNGVSKSFVSPSGTIPATTGAAAGYWVLGGGTTCYMDGDLFELIVVYGACTDQEIAEVNEYLLGQYGTRVDVDVTDTLTVTLTEAGSAVPRHRILSTTVEAEFSPGVWTDITTSIMRGLSWEYGMAGMGPLDRCAGSGSLRGVIASPTTGYWAPDHASCRAGWGLNTRLRVKQTDDFDIYTRFVGRVRGITPMAGRYVHAGSRVTFEARDWMDEAAEMAVSGVAAQVDRRADEILDAVVTAAATQPTGTDYDPGDSVFPFALDDASAEETRLLQVFSDIAQSEQGYLYLRGDGTLVFEGRLYRASHSDEPVFSFDDTMTGLDVAYAPDARPTKVKVTVNPRRVDASATTVLFKRYDIADGQSAAMIRPGESLTVFGAYGDPNNGNQQCGGTDMVPPVATTDYTANAQADGLGTNLTANLTVVASCTASGVSELLTNTGASTLYVTRTQVRGRGIFNQQPTMQIVGSGSAVVSVDMRYEANPNNGTAAAGMILAAWGAASACTVTFLTATDALLLAALTCDIGTRIGVKETATGISGEFYVQSVACALVGAALMKVTWRCIPADSAQYCVLDQPNACELDETATIGY